MVSPRRLLCNLHSARSSPPSPRYPGILKKLNRRIVFSRYASCQACEVLALARRRAQGWQESSSVLLNLCLKVSASSEFSVVLVFFKRLYARCLSFAVPLTPLTLLYSGLETCKPTCVAKTKRRIPRPQAEGSSPGSLTARDAGSLGMLRVPERQRR